jgi:hypothetical protein
VLPACGSQGLACAIGLDQSEKRSSRLLWVESADAGDGDTCDRLWDALVCGRGKEEFVILASMKGGMKRSFEGKFLCKWMERQSGEVYLSAKAGGLAEMREVGGEAVAEVDASSGKSAPQQSLANDKTGLGEEVGMVPEVDDVGNWPAPRKNAGEFRGGSSERSCDVEGVAGTGS